MPKWLRRRGMKTVHVADRLSAKMCSKWHDVLDAYGIEWSWQKKYVFMALRTYFQHTHRGFVLALFLCFVRCCSLFILVKAVISLVCFVSRLFLFCFLFWQIAVFCFSFLPAVVFFCFFVWGSCLFFIFFFVVGDRIKHTHTQGGHRTAIAMTTLGPIVVIIPARNPPWS